MERKLDKHELFGRFSSSWIVFKRFLMFLVTDPFEIVSVESLKYEFKVWLDDQN